ncbi:MAG: UDP-3-O-(3-hydroxymyristoyl)glucosamine N-acyltransferase [Gammaproteobacteria bacterium]|nr:MAG: UDP-3-O-(3-hydroxymyristoyl)glucosamine N-acyltransferase [Gammaproteobacteria bacterium]
MSKRGFSLEELSRHVGGEVRGNGSCIVYEVGTLENASGDSIAFLANPRYRKYLATTRACAVVLSPEEAKACPVPALVVHNPYLAFARIAALIHPPPPAPQGIHPTAWVSPESHVHKSAWIGPKAVVEEGAVIEAGVFVGPGCYVGRDVHIGEGSRLVAHVSLCPGVRLGREVLIHPGAVVGSEGFGLAQDGESWVKVPQVGRVYLGDNVEVGANTTIDRGTMEDTVLEKGVKLDNQIQVGHNVRIGEHTAIAGCVGIAGSTHIGKRCIIGGGVGIGGHLVIADDVHITGMSMVTRSITRPGLYSSGMPLQPNPLWRKNAVRLKQLDELARRLKVLEERAEK